MREKENKVEELLVIVRTRSPIRTDMEMESAGERGRVGVQYREWYEEGETGQEGVNRLMKEEGECDAEE